MHCENLINEGPCSSLVNKLIELEWKSSLLFWTISLSWREMKLQCAYWVLKSISTFEWMRYYLYSDYFISAYFRSLSLLKIIQQLLTLSKWLEMTFNIFFVLTFWPKMCKCKNISRQRQFCWDSCPKTTLAVKSEKLLGLLHANMIHMWQKSDSLE